MRSHIFYRNHPIKCIYKSSYKMMISQNWHKRCLYKKKPAPDTNLGLVCLFPTWISLVTKSLKSQPKKQIPETELAPGIRIVIIVIKIVILKLKKRIWLDELVDCESIYWNILKWSEKVLYGSIFFFWLRNVKWSKESLSNSFYWWSMRFGQLFGKL